MSELKTPQSFMTRVAANTNAQMGEDATLIAKEQLTAYQRWELPSFSSAPPAAQTAALALSTAAELQQIKQLAHQQGFKEGQHSGQEAGYEAGYATGAKLAQLEVTSLHELIHTLEDGLTQLDQDVAQTLVDMSISIARKMISQTMEVKPELILELVREAIAQLPQFNQNPHLLLNPVDAELVRKFMSDELSHTGWKIFSDVQVRRGGCMVKTAHSLIDATLEARWERVLQSIGQDGSWLA
jgi:flagellar assembly protein FliH